MIAPNKQNLILLKAELKTTQNGFKLLKEKRSGLIITFLNFAREGKELEAKLTQGFTHSLDLFSMATSYINNSKLASDLEPIPSTHLKVSKKRLSGVAVDILDLDIKNPVREDLKPKIQESFLDFTSNFSSLIKLTQLKLNITKVAKEILKTNRQISNLEQKIDNTHSEIKRIKQVLMEKENLEKSILMKIFQ